MSDWGKSWSDTTNGWNTDVKVNLVKEQEKLKEVVTQIELELFVPCKVQGEAIGDLMIYGWQGEWYIAHIPTETRFDKAVPEGDWTKEQLIMWCSKVQKTNRSDWEKLSQAGLENYYDSEYDNAKEQIKNHCLSIEVS